jgi:hypothetical protein
MAAAQTKGPIPGDLGQLQRMEAEGLDAARNRRIAPPATPDRLEGVIEAKDAASRAIAAILDPIAGGADAMLHMNKVLTSRDDVLPELRRRGLEREKRELERDARGLARLVQAGRLSSKEATDTYYQKARVLTVHNPAKYDPQAEENALILAAGAAFDQYIREKTLSGRPGEPTIGNWISGGALGNDTLHHFFANAYNTYLGVPTPIQRYAANAGEEDARDVNANNLGSRFGTRLRRGRVRPSEVITSPPPGRETPVDRVF